MREEYRNPGWEEGDDTPVPHALIIEGYGREKEIRIALRVILINRS